MTLLNRQSKKIRISLAIFSLSLFIFGCVSKPITVEKINIEENLPLSTAQLTEINAKSPDEIELVFEVTTKNTDTEVYQLKQVEAIFQLDGVHFGTQILKPDLLLPSNSTSMQKLSFPMDLRKIPALISEDLQYNLDLSLDFRNNEGEERTSTASLKGSFLRVNKPLFRIRSIKIHRAELINTSMKVSLEIENPNEFPLELASLTYEIFGENRYWAEGLQKGSFQINAYDKIVVIAQISMNFIDMKRELLDQFIEMQDVGYRFKGHVQVLTGIRYLPEFIMKFDEQGRTEVIE
ncbi:MAG TPA: LEA type 2 family protein [Treponemataceae bacterium]|nr:LEA type 2 family protein [Treponemataceae bacterium]